MKHIGIFQAVVLLGPATVAAAADLNSAPPVAVQSWWDTVSITGHVEAGLTANPASPPDGINFGHLFTDKANRFLLNQTVLTIQRPLSTDPSGYDVGFKLQTLYGSDARATQFLGQFDYSINGLNQFNIVEAYGVAHLPWLTAGGIDVKLGQFVTLEGAEVIYAPDNLLYSHSYIFNFGIPFKHTGILTTTHVNEVLDVFAGVVSGVNTTLGRGDNNGSASFHGGFALNNLLGSGLTITATTLIGPENPGVPSISQACLCNPNRSLRYLNDVTAVWKASERLVFTTDLNYIKDDGFKADGYGVAQYVSYAVNDWLKVVVRGEIWRDNKGFFVAAFPGNFDFVNAEYGRPNGSYSGGRTTYGAVTAGLNLTPTLSENIFGIKQLIIRPEVRYDTSLNGTTPFGRGTKGSQFTFGGDIIVPFSVK